MFVGLPVCESSRLAHASHDLIAQQRMCLPSKHLFAGRDPDYAALTVEFTATVLKCARFINYFPVLLQP